VALDPVTERVAEVDALLVGEAELFRELVHTLLCQDVPFVPCSGSLPRMAVFRPATQCCEAQARRGPGSSDGHPSSHGSRPGTNRLRRRRRASHAFGGLFPNGWTGGRGRRTRNHGQRTADLRRRLVHGAPLHAKRPGHRTPSQCPFGALDLRAQPCATPRRALPGCGTGACHDEPDQLPAGPHPATADAGPLRLTSQRRPPARRRR
jgi:hypothetical protein